MADTLYHVALLLLGVALLLLVGAEAGAPHLLTLAVALELLLLAAAVGAVAASLLLDDLLGPFLALLLLPVAGAESAVSLAHLIAFAPVRGTILLRAPHHAPGPAPGGRDGTSARGASRRRGRRRRLALGGPAPAGRRGSTQPPARGDGGRKSQDRGSGTEISQ